VIYMECKFCGGTGYVELIIGTETCPSCQGTGKHNAEQEAAKLPPLKK